MKPLNATGESEDTRLLVRYLLDELSEGEQERVEERYASDETFYSKLLATEDELIDSYVLGDISNDDRARFEQVYLSNPHRRKKVESNRALLEMVDNVLSRPPLHRRLIASLRRTISNPHVTVSYSFAALLLIAALSGVVFWLLWERAQLHNELGQAKSQWNKQAELYEQQIATLKEPPSANPQPSPTAPVNQDLAPDRQKKEVTAPLRWSRIVAFALHGGGRTRGGEGGALKRLIIPRGAVLVRLTIDVVPNDFHKYKVSLQRPVEENGWEETVEAMPAGFSTKKIVVNVPATFFKHRDYILKVTGDSPDDILAFHHITAVNQNLPQARKTGETRREE
jgi:hypothetical protein